MDTMDDLHETILTIYENTDAAQLEDPTARYARVTHFLQRATDDIWYDRSWPFTMGSSSLTMVGGAAARPSDFAGLTEEGGLWDSNGRPWKEQAYQDMAVIRARGVEQASKLFSVGAQVLVPDTTSTATFTLVYQTTSPTIQTYGASQAFVLPYGFWQPLLLGAVTLIKHEAGDVRETWRKDYQSALAKQQKLWKGMASRIRRMPNTVGGQY